MSENEYQWCPKRYQRIKITVCLFRKCSHLREKEGDFSCRFISAAEKRIRGKVPQEVKNG